VLHALAPSYATGTNDVRAKMAEILSRSSDLKDSAAKGNPDLFDDVENDLRRCFNEQSYKKGSL
jgi:hypothetical protein